MGKIKNADIVEIHGLNEMDDVQLNNAQIDDLETEEVNLMLLAIDASGSMSQYVNTMMNELEAFKKAITDSKEEEKILVSRVDFSDSIWMRGYKKIREFDTDYRIYTNTRLYDVIIEGAKRLSDYMDMLKKNGMRIKSVFAIFSDGQDTASISKRIDAKRVIDELNQHEIVTAFVSFGNDAVTEANALGIKNIVQVGQSESELRKAFAQLSKSMISQSKSVVAKTDDFFEL